MSVCHKSHYFQVTTSWIAEDDDIYIMAECPTLALPPPLLSHLVMSPIESFFIIIMNVYCHDDDN